jgi:uncharacterized protein YjeT (DUF2065 family)
MPIASTATYEQPKNQYPRKSFLAVLFSAAVFSIVVSAPYLPISVSEPLGNTFEITVTSAAAGNAQLFYDVGRGINGTDSSWASVHAGPAPQRLKFALPAGEYRGLRYDPIDRGGISGTLDNASIRKPDGSVAQQFASGDFVAQQQITVKSLSANGVTYAATPDGADPVLTLKVAAPFQIKPATLTEKLIVLAKKLSGAIPWILAIFIVALGLVWLLGRQHAPIQFLWAWCQTCPWRAIALVGLLAVVASSYPVVFFERSFVSPNLGTILLYEQFPTLPGYDGGKSAHTAGSDTGALMWGHLPMASVERHALTHHLELPLWNRYNTCGAILLGQGQSIFGDPLHFLILAANNAAWAWDLKYLIAKWLFAFGIGLCVMRTTRHLPTAVMLAATMPFIGFFIYRINHPAIFSVCYAPWILLCWLGVAGADRWRGAAAWVGGLMLANWSEMNSGTVKEAYMALIVLNSAGVSVLAFAALSIAERLRRLAIATIGGVIFTLLSSPVWLTFLDALAGSFTVYDTPQVFQIQPSLVLGFFDELFFRPYNRELVLNGSVNFLVLLGIIAFFVYAREICRTERTAIALGLVAVVPGAIILGVVPAQWLRAIPFVSNLQHTDNSFFCPMITLLGVLAGYGFRTAARRLGGAEGPGDLAIAALMLGALFALYFSFGQTAQRSVIAAGSPGEHLVFTPFVTGGIIALLAATVGFGLITRQVIRHRKMSPATILLLASCSFVLLWRHGQHLETVFPDYVVSPTSRVNFREPSPAIDALRADQRQQPGRFAGIGNSAFPGWMNMYELEGVSGIDPLLNRHYRELQEALGFELMWGWRVYLRVSTMSAQRSAFDFLNVRYYLAGSAYNLAEKMMTRVTSADLNLYRSESAWPRAFFTDRVVIYDNAKTFGKLVTEGDGKPFAAMQADDDSLPRNLVSTLDGRVVLPARNYRLTSNTTGFDVEATGPGMVVLSESWLKGDFRARLDGRPVPYFRVNHAFKGVQIDSAGLHRIDFEYWPRRFTASLIMAGFGLLSLAVALWLTFRRQIRAA